MKKLFIVSDVHSYYDELISALNSAGFDINNNNHIFVSLGDLLDRGTKPKECLNFALDLYNKNRAILIQGNHEDLMVDCLLRGYFKSYDIHNGTSNTVYDITGFNDSNSTETEQIDAMKHNDMWNTYLQSCVDYAEINENIFVHGWIPVKRIYSGTDVVDFLNDYYTSKYTYNPEWRNPIWQEDWSEARWFNGMKMWHDGIKEPGRTIWCGHYHVSWGHSHLHDDGVEFLKKIETYYINPETGRQEPHVNWDPFEDDGIVAMDACTVISGKVNCKTLEISDDNWRKFLNENKYK